MKNLALLLIVLLFLSCQKGKYDLANTPDEFVTLTADPNSNIAHNLQDFDKMIKVDKELHDAIGEPELILFKRSLRFNNGGLATASYEMVQKKISGDQFEKLFNIFGISGGLFKDYDRKECKSKGTCAPKILHICTSNC